MEMEGKGGEILKKKGEQKEGPGPVAAEAAAKAANKIGH